MAMITGISITLCRKRSILVILYTTVVLLCISQITYDVNANEVTDVQDTVYGSEELHNSSRTSELNRPEDHIENTTSSTGDSPGFYQKYKQFVAKHNRTFTIVFGVLFVISLAVAIWLYATKGEEKNRGLVIIPILLGIVVFSIVICKICSQKGLTVFRSKKVPTVKDTVDSSA